MRKCLLTMAAFAVIAGALVLRKAQDDAQDARLCALMERQDEFDGETVDILWHWRREGHPSYRFQRLYAEKIADLPGWRP